MTRPETFYTSTVSQLQECLDEDPQRLLVHVDDRALAAIAELFAEEHWKRIQVSDPRSQLTPFG